jgi:ribosome-binding protein aMBF1 (putative translation factor)
MKKKSWDTIVETISEKHGLDLEEIANRLKVDLAIVENWLHNKKTPCVKCRCELLKLFDGAKDTSGT